MIPISPLLTIYFAIFCALFAMAVGALSGVLASFLLRLPIRGVLKNALLGLLGFLGFFVAILVSRPGAPRLAVFETRVLAEAWCFRPQDESALDRVWVHVTQLLDGGSATSLRISAAGSDARYAPQLTLAPHIEVVKTGCQSWCGGSQNSGWLVPRRRFHSPSTRRVNPNFSAGMTVAGVPRCGSLRSR